MILVDSSVWVDHFRYGLDVLADLLQRREVLSHPAVTGELALGHARREAFIIDEMSELPAAEAASDEETLAFIRQNALAGSGIGYADAHLLAATRLTPDAALWTRDRRLLVAARRLGLAAEIEPHGGFHED